jgi:putative heme-binding domain-containing protein
MTTPIAIVLAMASVVPSAGGADSPAVGLPEVAAAWSIELAAQAPQILFPTAIVAAPDGTVYLGSDPMDMPGPPTEPIDRVLALKDRQVTVFAEKLWSVMGLEWLDGTLYVVHAPYLSAFRDTNGDGRADSRIDLVTGLGPKLPGFNGINDHIASGVRMGMDGFLYIAVGDKGIPRGVGRDGKTIRLFGGGVIRVRPDGTGLQVVSTGECNPLSVALSATDEIFTYGNDDDSKKWPNSLTHHIVGGHFGYPYQFLTAPHRALPIMAGQFGGVGTQGICYNEDGLPAEYRGNLFFCDWGLQTVFRFEIKKAGGTFALVRRTALVSKGQVPDFRPFSLAVAADGRTLWLVDWAYSGWLANGPHTGRLYRLRTNGSNSALAAPRPSGEDPAIRVKSLDHPALAVRLESQRILARKGTAAVPQLIDRLSASEPETGRLHALWALDAIGGSDARRAIGSVLADSSSKVRLQAARSMGIRRDRTFMPELLTLLRDRDAAVRREAAIAVGNIGDRTAARALYTALGDADQFAAWSVREAIRRLSAWDKQPLVEALMDERRLEPALRLTDEAWSVTAVQALTEALSRTSSAAVRGRIIANLAGQSRRYPEWSGQWFGTNPLAGPFPQKTAEWSIEGMKEVQTGLVLGLADRDSTVRFEAIGGLREFSSAAAPMLRTALIREPDPRNQRLLITSLATLSDRLAIPLLVAIVSDAKRTEEVRSASLAALAKARDRQSVSARFALIYDPGAPAALVARALPDLARSGYFPPNDLVAFLEHPAPAVRAAAVLSLNVKKSPTPELERSLVDKLDDQAAEVREAAMLAVVPLQLRSAVPRLLVIARDIKSQHRYAAIASLCGIPDPRALPIYLAVIQDRDPQMRRHGESALLAIREQVSDELHTVLAAGNLSESAQSTLERVLARFEPIRDWRVIGPYPRATPTTLFDERSINFEQTHKDALGRSIAWMPREADASSGRLNLDDFQHAAHENGGFGYDENNSPDLGVFACAEIDAARAGPALMLIGSSGTLVVTVNEKPVYQYTSSAGRGYDPNTETVRFELAKGRNRVLVLSRQGIGPWSFGLQIAQLDPSANRQPQVASSIAKLRQFAMEHEGDPKKGEAIFFDDKRIVCARCHKVAGRGAATVGPDLTGLASKYERAEVIRSVLEPSHRIATGYLPVIVATRDGKVVTGVQRSESDRILELAGSDGTITRIAKSDIQLRRVGDLSIMPANQVESLSSAEFADLVSFLMRRAASPSRSDPQDQKLKR